MDELAKLYIRRLEGEVEHQRQELANLKKKRQRLIDRRLDAYGERLDWAEKVERELISLKKDIASLVEDNDRLRGITGPKKRPGRFQIPQGGGFW